MRTPFEGKTQTGGKELGFSPAPPQTFTNPSSRTTSVKSNISQLTTCKSTTTQYLWVGQDPKTITVKVPNQGQFRAGALTRFLQEWSNVTDDPVTLQAIRGVRLPMIARPPVRRPSRAEMDERRKEPAIDAAIKVAPYQV